MIQYGVIIDSDMIQNVISTDKLEVLSYFNISLLLWVIFLLVAPVAFVLITKIKYPNLKTRAKLVLFSLFGIGIIFAYSSHIFIPFFREYRHVRFFIMPFYPIYSAIKQYQISTQQNLPFEFIAQDAVLRDNSKKIFVMIVGETQRSANYSLNGYTKNDTNFYTKNKNVVSFSEFYSCGTATMISVPCMFSDLKRDSFSNNKAKNRENLIDIILKTGIKTYWFGNNSGGCKGVCKNISKDNKKEYRASVLDEVVFEQAIKIIKDTQDSVFIVIHIQGSHGPAYFKWYSSEFRKFKPTCDTSELTKCSPDEITNTYDNTILYQDFLQSKLINELENKGYDFKTAMLFVSDHGESLGENGVYLHGLPYPMAPKHQKHVPMIFYSNDKNIINSLLNLKDKKFSHDNIFSSILGFMKIDTKAYDKNMDIFANKE